MSFIDKPMRAAPMFMSDLKPMEYEVNNDVALPKDEVLRDLQTMISKLIKDISIPKESSLFKHFGTTEGNNPLMPKYKIKQPIKSKIKRKKNQSDFNIEQYLKDHPDILNKYIKNYITNNIKIEYKPEQTRFGTQRIHLILKDNNEEIYESVFGISI